MAYLKKYKEEASSQVLLEKPGYGELLQPYFQPLSAELLRWSNEPYEKNSKHPENLIHKCTSGILVRSKSESIIASYLHIKKIPFRYECVLHLNGISVFPDFTIRHPKTGQVYYWEHFGMMDQSAYAKNAGLKLQNYIAHGIIPSIQLITTYETEEYPLSAAMVEDIVQHYFA